jgi:hypothetical protein
VLRVEERETKLLAELIVNLCKVHYVDVKC